jgi:RNA polymerase sigma-B factor
MRDEMSRVANGEMYGGRQRGSHLSHAQAAELQRAYRREGDLGARALLIEAHLPLVRSLAQRFAHRGERIEDLVQVGSIGLINAVDRYEPARGVDLAAFAVPTIVGEIKRHLRDRSSLIRVPRRQQETTVRLGRARRQLTRRLQRPPTRLELVAATDVSERDLAEAAQVGRAQAPLTLAEGARAATAEDVFEASDDRIAVRTGMRTLHRRERQALRCRYFGDMTQSEVAQTLGISQTHASRLLASGLTKLRENLDGKSESSGRSELDSGHGDSRRRPGRAA